MPGIDRPGVRNREGDLQRLRLLPPLRIGRVPGLDAPDRDPGGRAAHDREDERREDEAQPQPAPPLDRGQLAGVEIPCAPVEHCAGEHVVVDLVRVLTGGTHDARATGGELRQDGCDRCRRRSCVLREVVDAVCDLGSRRSHEVAEHRRCDLLFVGAQGVEGVIEMRADDPLRAAEALERLEPKLTRACSALLVPEAGQDELEVRRLDRARARAARCACSVEQAFAGAPEREAADFDLVEDLLDEGRLG